MAEAKCCTKCGEVKPTEQFRLRKALAGRKAFHCGSCLACDRAAGRLRMAALPVDRKRAANRRRNEKLGANIKDHRARIRRRAKERNHALGLTSNGKHRKLRLPHPKLAIEERTQRYAAMLERKRLETAKNRKHDAHVVLFKSLSRAYRIRYRHDAEFNLKERMRASLRKKAKRYAFIGNYFGSAAKGRSAYCRVWSAVGYTASTLRAHIERQFSKGMTWDRFLAGHIHIDHIVAVSTFDLNSEEQVRQAYALSNLQPLWAKANLMKSDKIEYIV